MEVATEVIDAASELLSLLVTEGRLNWLISKPHTCTIALVNFISHPHSPPPGSPHPRWGFDIASCPHPWGN